MAGFVYILAILAVTHKLIWQEAPPPRVPPLKEIVPPPAGALTVPRLQELVIPGALAMTTPAGKTSVKARSETGVPEPLVMVKVTLLALPGPMVLGANVLERVGCADTWDPVRRRSTNGSTSRCKHWFGILIRFMVFVITMIRNIYKYGLI